MLYGMRRVADGGCGVAVDTAVPWAQGIHQPDRLRLVPGHPAQAFELNGGRRGLPYHLGESVSPGVSHRVQRGRAHDTVGRVQP